MTIEARHIIELRTALSQAYMEAGIALPIYTDDPPMVGGTLIRATHIAEPRTARLVIE